MKKEVLKPNQEAIDRATDRIMKAVKKEPSDEFFEKIEATESTCADCRATKDIIHGPCPFQEEINNTIEYVSLCPNCYRERVMDI
jgi:hypothetical protein